MRAVVIMPAPALYPGEAPVPVHEAGVAVPGPGVRPDPGAPDPAPALVAEAGKNGCTGRRADGGLCNGNAGPDGRCARHKDT
jgi:hypothetical protein